MSVMQAIRSDVVAFPPVFRGETAAVSREALMKPLMWRQPALAPLLADAQANILKGHGRKHTRNIFFTFDPARRATIRAALARIELTSAIDQLEAGERKRLEGADGGAVRLLFLSHHGYRALGIADDRIPADPAFRAGMADAVGLGDPPVDQWDAGFRQPVDAMLLIGDASADRVAAVATPIMLDLMAAGARLATYENGAALMRDGQGIEHFGFADGRSQPLMLDDDVARELNHQGEPFVWDPQFGPAAIALTIDPGGDGANSYGSYLVFRKLEQNVAGFKAAEEALADALQLMTPDARAMAGALIVGRFEDGTPVVTSKRPVGRDHVANNFGYGGDPAAARCPFHSHIRKMNPRGDTVALGSTVERERSHLMPRRGITYGQRAADLGDRPERGVGLLFMAYNRDIGQQFEFAQRVWANTGDYPQAGAGGDPLVGDCPMAQKWPVSWDHPEAGTIAFDFGKYVTMKGGEYFFAPSLGFVRGLGGRDD